MAQRMFSSSSNSIAIAPAPTSDEWPVHDSLGPGTLRFTLLATLLSLGFVAGCSSTRTSLTGPGASNANNSRLKGNYTYTLGGTYAGVTSEACGYCLNGPYQREGTFVSDGKGHITSGTDIFIQGSSPSTHTMTGSYSIADDGTGIMLLTAGGAQLELAFTMISNSSLSWIEFDSFGGGAGGARFQNAGQLNSAPSGTFVFRIHASEAGAGSLESVSAVGRMIISGGTVSGREDVVQAGTFNSVTITGSLTAPDASGKGSLSLTDSLGNNTTYLYYVIDSNTLNFIETDSDPVTGKPRLGAGRAEVQSNLSFDDTSFSNGFVFSSSGETLSTPFSVISIGALTADGGGNITSGSYDSVTNGQPIGNAAITGSYSVSPAGRVSLALTSQIIDLTSIQEVAWMVSPSRAFYLVNVPGRAEDGTLNQQQSAPFSQGSLNGQFAFSMFGGDNQSPSEVDRVGVATFDGQSKMALVNYFVNRGGSTNQTKSSPVAYSVDPNGRVSASLEGLTNAFVMYLTSNSSGALILEDPQTEITGGMAQQSSQ